MMKMKKLGVLIEREVASYITEEVLTPWLHDVLPSLLFRI